MFDTVIMLWKHKTADSLHNTEQVSLLTVQLN